MMSAEGNQPRSSALEQGQPPRLHKSDGSGIGRRLGQAQPNPWAVLRSDLDGRLTDLTDTNPTNHGLTDPRVAEILAKAAHQSAYDPHPRGNPAAREALAERLGGTPEQYWLTASTSEAYGWLFQLLTAPGESVALPQPGYPLIQPLAKLQGLDTCAYWWHYLETDGWVLDEQTLHQAAGQAQVLVVVNPGNPTGAYANVETIQAAAAKANMPLIADEVFR
ncbi:MAG: aminotransferase class I/II-fold pyridoxal phosphate-dependent enzyme, partial [Bifidobacteriaceae bacterium]|nr:aminotransferase class I/II-fold pyridoxal phosphate-dependent enzyme [Bifidobacteriaceae bacterium]